MTSTRTPEPVPRPRSPWSGSRYETWHRWQPDRVTSLAEASQVVGAADARVAAGGRLCEADDGFVQVRYGCTAC